MEFENKMKFELDRQLIKSDEIHFYVTGSVERVRFTYRDEEFDLPMVELFQILMFYTQLYFNLKNTLKDGMNKVKEKIIKCLQ